MESQVRAYAGLRTLRSVFFGLVVVGFLGLAGALISYRADMAEARGHSLEHVARNGALYAESLSLHLARLQAELRRIADHLASRGSARPTAFDRSLFANISLFTVEGAEQWSDPFPTSHVANVTSQPWFQKVLRQQTVDVEELDASPHDDRLAVAVPVQAGGPAPAVLLGVVDALNRPLLSPGSSHEQRWLVGPNGGVLLRTATAAAPVPDAAALQRLIDTLLVAPDGLELDVLGEPLFAYATRVPETELTLVVTEPQSDRVNAIRWRLFLQLLFLAVVQLAGLAGFLLYFRRVHRAFLAAEEKIAQQQTMAALGTAASLIAHEVKNSLNSIKAAGGMLERQEEPALAAKTLRGQVERLGHLASSLLTFAKPTLPRPQPVKLNEVASRAAEALTSLPEFGEVKLQLELTSEAALSGDPLLLYSALDNLMRNAIEAAVAAKDVGKNSQPFVRVAVSAGNGWCECVVEDNGGAAATDLETRLGEPFFTTKAKGIGLGLALTRRVAEQHGGTLRLERLADGTRFIFRVPGTR